MEKTQADKRLQVFDLVKTYGGRRALMASLLMLLREK